MSIAAAETLVLILGIYALIGVVFAIFFVTLGAGRIDPNAKSMPLQTRVMIFPGAAGLWPLLVLKVLTQREPPA